MRAFAIVSFALFSGMALAGERDFQAPLIDNRPIAYASGSGSSWLNQWAADGFCNDKGFDGAESFESAGYVYGYTGEVIFITKRWVEGYSVEKKMSPRTELFARITCR